MTLLMPLSWQLTMLSVKRIILWEFGSFSGVFLLFCLDLEVEIYINESMEDTPLKYCLYARKSSEADEKQALSIDSQISEMHKIAEQE